MQIVLAAAVDEFVNALAPVVQALGNQQAKQDVELEALNLSLAFITVDERDTDAELWELIATFGTRVQQSLIGATPNDLRKGYTDRREFWLVKPSPLFLLLIDTDKRNNTKHAWMYYERALHLAHAVSALDLLPSETELDAIERFRSNMLELLGPRDVIPEKASAVPNVIPEKASAAPNVIPEKASAAHPGNSGDAEKPESIDDLLTELDALIGLEGVKREVKLVANFLQVQALRKQHGLPVVQASRHLVFTGNPGTGKTTVARLLSRIYKTLKVVDKGHLVETDRAGLVVGYVGQTAGRTTEVFNSALGGVLLIDEAYSLARGDHNDFGKEAIDTLVKLIEDHREDIVVIAAGYPDEMHTFVDSNPGLRSRFPKTIAFPDYTTAELLAIFESITKKQAYTVDDAVRTAVREYFDAQPRTQGFGNGRLARNLFESAVSHHASRIVGITEPTSEQLMLLTKEDVQP
jgi:AAA+ superfamily predicted ATPase